MTFWLTFNTMAADLPELFGTVIYNTSFSDSNQPVGYYSIGEDGTTRLIQKGPNAKYGGVRIGNIYYTVYYSSFFGQAYIKVKGYDVETWDVVAEINTDDKRLIAPGGIAFDPVSGFCYAIGWNEEGDGLQLTKLQFDGNNVTVATVAALEGEWNSIACGPDGQLWAISTEGYYQGEGAQASYVCDASYLNKLNKKSGAVTRVGDTGQKPAYMSGACIDPKSGRMFWNLCPADEKGYLCELDLATGRAEVLFAFEQDDQIVGLYSPMAKAADKAPAECSRVDVSFENGSFEGSLTLTAPRLLFDGSQPAQGERLYINVTANGNRIARSETEWGAEVTIPLYLTQGGKYDFSVFASNDTGNGPAQNFHKVWVGPDTPLKPEPKLRYADGEMIVEWEPVSQSLNGGWMDPAALTYTVRRADNSIATTGLSQCYFSEPVEDPAYVITHRYTVEAVCGALSSGPAATNTVTLGSKEPPYKVDFTRDGFTGFTILDINGDNRTWTLEQSNNRTWVQYNKTLAMDDWMITPPLRLEEGKAYVVSFRAYNNSNTTTETLEVTWGTVPTPEGLGKVLLEPTPITGKDEGALVFTGRIVPEVSGIHYIGFHGMSEPDQFRMYVDRIEISEGMSAAGPAKVSDLKAVAEESGELKATVSFTAPTLAMDGSPVGNLERIEVMRNNTLIHTLENPLSGAPYSITDLLETYGEAKYEVVAYNDHGEGDHAVATAFVGFDLPVGVSNLTASRTLNEGEVRVAWTASACDIRGRKFPEGKVQYALFIEGDEAPLVTGISSAEHIFQAAEPDQQVFVRCVVVPYTSAGQGEMAMSNRVVVGTPYDGLEEKGQFGRYAWAVSKEGGAEWSLYTDNLIGGIEAADGDNQYFACYGNAVDKYGSLTSGLVSLAGMSRPMLSFQTFNISDGTNPDINELEISIKDSESDEWTVVEHKSIAEIAGSNEIGWYDCRVPLEGFEGKTVQVQFTATTKHYRYTALDAVRIADLHDIDLGIISFSTPTRVKGGSAFTVSATIRNFGSLPVESFSVEITSGYVILASGDFGALPPGETLKAEFNLDMPAYIESGLPISAKATVPGDGNNDNNISNEIFVRAIDPGLPKPSGLAAAVTGSGMQLSWTQPALPGNEATAYSNGVPFTEDFESGEPWCDSFGEWLFDDGDGAAVGGFKGVHLPDITAGETAGSFWVWDQDTADNTDASFAAHSGRKYLFSLFRYDNGPADDWAISPRLNGQAQKISFWAKSYNAMYPEKVEVYYSTGGLDTSDFIKIEDAGDNTVEGTWTLYEADLPTGAEYFAIRSCAPGAFMLMIDDVTYTPGTGTSGKLTLEGYNLYRNGLKLNHVPLTSTSYTDATINPGITNAYAVTAVYSEAGESGASHTEWTPESIAATPFDADIVVYTSGHTLHVKAPAGTTLSIIDSLGRRVAQEESSGHDVFRLPGGIYMVQAAGNTFKTIL